MLDILPSEILDIIFNKAISTYNNNSMKLRCTSTRFNNYKYIVDLQYNRNCCTYCKFIFNNWINYPKLLKYPGIISNYNEILCKNHYYICEICKEVSSYKFFYPYYNKCFKCIKNNYN